MKRWDEIEGWLEVGAGGILKRLATDRDCLEIGSFKGKSTLALASTAKSVLCIDTFKADGGGQHQKESFTTLDEFIKNIQGYDNVAYLIGKSEDVLPTITDKIFDLVYIDGFHSFAQVSYEIVFCSKLIRSDGVFAFHDADRSAVMNAIEKVFDKTKLMWSESLAWTHNRDRRI